MNAWALAAVVFLTCAAYMALACRLAWGFWYYVVAAKNPIGKTALTGIAALYLFCATVIALAEYGI